MRRERNGTLGDPSVQERALLERFAEVGSTRSRCLEMTAKGLMTFEQLGARLEELEGSREIILQELEEVRHRRESAETLERDREVLLAVSASSQAESLEDLEPEERHRVYRMLQLEVFGRERQPKRERHRRNSGP